MHLTDRIASFLGRVQTELFPSLEETWEGLTPQHLALLERLELLQVERFVPVPRVPAVGAPLHDRRCLARAFLAKAFYNATDTKAFRERLLVDHALRKICGWMTRRAVPSEATFSRAFADFAETQLLDRVLEGHVITWLRDGVSRNASTDSSAIPARETPVTKAKPQLTGPKEAPPPPRPRGRRPKEAPPLPPPAPTRLERQVTQEPEIALLELPTRCDVGGKTDSKGHTAWWVGYKLHVRVEESGLPLAAVTTAASVHDSQVAIPLMKLSDRRVTSLYELMDRAYDAEAIRVASELAGHVAIIDYRKKRGAARAQELAPDRAEHYQDRTVVERFFSRLKDGCGGLMVRVRGHRKVHAHLMCGVLMIFAEQLLRLGR